MDITSSERFIDMLVLIIITLFTRAAPKAPCTCGGDRPCQHTSGSSCYPMMHSPSGALQCPSETNHCECECTAGAPCYMGHGEKGCVGTYIMYGTEVCPVGRCEGG